MPVSRLVVRICAALLFALPLAAQEFSLDFRDSTIVGRENQWATVTVVLTGPPVQNNLTIDYTYTIDGLDMGGDWETLFAGRTSASWSIRLLNDNLYTSGKNGTITIRYHNPHTLQQVQKSAPIQVDDDEFVPYANVGEARVLESDGGIQSVPITLSHQSIFPTTLSVTACCGTATANSDYVLLDASYTFAPYQTEGEVRFQVFSDSASEGPETFTLGVGGRYGIVTIVEEDLFAELSLDSQRVVAGEPFQLGVRLPDVAPGPFMTSIEIGDEGIVSIGKQPRWFQLGRGTHTFVLWAGMPGTTTITVTPDSVLYAPATVAIEVYDVGFDVSEIPVMRPGQEFGARVRMNPPGTQMELFVEVAPAGIITASSSIGFDGSGSGDLTINALKAGRADIKLTTPSGRLVSYFDVHVEEGLGVTAIAPANGPSSGGTSVTITGTAFRAPCTVKFGETAATGVSIVNETTLRATTPQHVQGLVDVSVTCDGATAKRTGAFTFTPVRGRAVRH